MLCLKTKWENLTGMNNLENDQMCLLFRGIFLRWDANANTCHSHKLRPGVVGVDFIWDKRPENIRKAIKTFKGVFKREFGKFSFFL